MSTSGGYHENIGGCSVHQGDIMIMWGDTMSTSGMFSTSERYHEYIGGYHEYIRDIQYIFTPLAAVLRGLSV